MSLYGVLFGESADSDRLYEILGLKEYDVQRYRDIYVRERHIVLLTRTGGGNREHYQETFVSLSAHPNYVCDEDCEWDTTYAEIFFSIPEAHREEVAKMSVSEDPGKKFGM